MIVSGDRRNQPVLGLEIIRGMRPDGEQWDGGTILNPETGDVYHCRMHLGPDGADARGARLHRLFVHRPVADLAADAGRVMAGGTRTVPPAINLKLGISARRDHSDPRS